MDLSANRITSLPVELRFMNSVVSLSLGENPLTSISEYTGGLEKLYSLNLNITRVPEWSDLDKMREYPSLTELRIKHCPVLEEYTAHERRMMLVARLPNIQVNSNLFPVEISTMGQEFLND